MSFLIILIIYISIVSLRGFYFVESITYVSFYTMQIHVLYISLTILYMALFRKKNLLCPELIISIVLYFGSFLLTLITYKDIPNRYIFDNYLLIRAISLATIGWVFFITGAVFINKKNNNGRYIKISKSNNQINTIRLFLVILTFCVLIIFLISDGQDYINRYKIGGELSTKVFWITILLTISSYYEFIRLNVLTIKTFTGIIKRLNKLYLLTILFFSIFLLITGNRSEAIQVMLPPFILYHYFIKKINKPTLIMSMISAIMILSLIRDARGSDSKKITIQEALSIESLTRDFIPSNAAIPVLIKHTEYQGPTIGKNMVYQILSTIPFLQGITLNIFNIDPEMPSSIINSKELRGENFDSGQGTNVIGDLFYSFGIFGVIFGMFIAGYIYTFLFNKINQRQNSDLSTIAFLILFGNIIYFVRVEYLYILRLLSFSLITTFIIRTLFYNAKKNINNHSTI